jgi:hypothetical protein
MFFPWYTFCLLFLIPFVDARRPFRAVHLDLLVLVPAGIGPLHDFFGAGELHGSLARYQQDRPGFNSIWGRFPDLTWLRTILRSAW